MIDFIDKRNTKKKKVINGNTLKTLLTVLSLLTFPVIVGGVCLILTSVIELARLLSNVSDETKLSSLLSVLILEGDYSCSASRAPGGSTQRARVTVHCNPKCTVCDEQNVRNIASSLFLKNCHGYAAVDSLQASHNIVFSSSDVMMKKRRRSRRRASSQSSDLRRS